NSTLTASVSTISMVTVAGGSDGSATITATGGTGSYTYSLLGTSESNNDGVFDGLSEGTYTVNVVDGNGCSYAVSFNITAPTGLVLSLVNKVDVSCFAGSNGAITVMATGSVSPYTYSLDGGAAQSSNSFTGLSAGTYTITATDANGNTASIDVTINEPAAALAASIASTSDASCFGSTDGAIALTVSGGTAPYTY
ncbi:SprB repeat-containing protein, partial [Belliella sp. DSM 111904]|nr:SprB repeat-containing protein [Belliella filtrata]